MNYANAQQSIHQRNKTVTALKPVAIKQVDSVKAILRPKLKIGAPNDVYEQEADRVAEQVMRMPVDGGQEVYQGEMLSIQTNPFTVSPIQRICSECETEHNSGTTVIKKKPNHSFEHGQSSAPDSVERTIKPPGSGSPLSESVRARVEPVLGADLSSIKVHTDSQSQLASRNIQAKAFTHGNNIFVGAGQSPHDVKLMAHEATHTVQQGGVRPLSNGSFQKDNSKEFDSIGFAGRKLLAHELTHVVQQNLRQTISSNGKNSKDEIYNYPGISIATRIPTAAPVIQRKFIGTDKKKVEMKKGEKDKHILIASNNASPDLIELIRLVNESGSITAVLQVLNASGNESEIQIKIERKRIANNLYGLHQAHDKEGKALTWNSDKGDFDGIPAYASDGVYKAATITIFKGNLEKGGGNKSSHDSAGIKLTLDQLLAGTFSHETGHNTDEEFINDLRKRREVESNKGIGAHENIDLLDERVYQEIGDYDGSELVCSRDDELAARRIDALNAGRTFPKDEIDEAKKYFTKNASQDLEERDRCLRTMHTGIEKVTNNDLPIYGTVRKTMDKLNQKGWVEGERKDVYFDTTPVLVDNEVWSNVWSKGQQVLTVKRMRGSTKRRYPKALKESIWKAVIELSKRDPGWSVFAMGLYDSNHGVTLTLDANDPSNPTIIWSDQWPSNNGAREYKNPNELDDRVTTLIQGWWKGVREGDEKRKPKYFKPVVRVWRLRRLKQEVSKRRKSQLRKDEKNSEKEDTRKNRLTKQILPPAEMRSLRFEQQRAKNWHHDLTKKPAKLEDETEITSPMIPKSNSDAQFGLSLGPHLRFSSGEETSAELALKFNYYLPLLLETKWRPFIYAGVHADTDNKIGTSGGIGARSDHLADMSLFLAGYTGLRTPKFNAVEYGGGLDAAWEFDKSRSLRLGVEWQTWLQMGDIEKRTYILGLTIEKIFD